MDRDVLSRVYTRVTADLRFGHLDYDDRGVHTDRIVITYLSSYSVATIANR